MSRHNNKIILLREHSKLIIVILLTVLIIGLMSLFALKYYFNDTVKTTNNTVSDEATVIDSKSKATVVRNNVAEVVYKSNNVEDGYKIYDEAMQNSSENELIDLYIGKTFLALNNNDPDMALEIALKAIDSVSSSSQIHPLYFGIAAAYEQKKDYSKAQEYYQKAYDNYSSETGTNDTGTAVYYFDKIDEMKDAQK